MAPTSRWARTLFATLLAPAALAQTFTACNPLQDACPSNQALGMNYTWTLNNSTLDNTSWNITDGTLAYQNQQSTFTINSQADSPTASSNFYIFWGSVSVVMKPSPGSGIVSSIALLSDDLDEVDWEWIGGNNTHVQTNYFGKGETGSFNRSTWVPVADPQNQWHNYTVAWTKDQLTWLIDGKEVRRLPYAQAENAGKNYPQTPLNVRLGLWKGGESKSQGTKDWAGGDIDWSQAPFNMGVQSVGVNDGTQGALTYAYGDHSGGYQSIQVTHGQSQVAAKLSAGGSSTVGQKVDGLSPTAKIAIVASVGGVAAILVAAWAVCCCKQRRAGRREHALEEAAYERQRTELQEYRKQMAGGAFAQGGGNALVHPPPARLSKF